MTTSWLTQPTQPIDQHAIGLAQSYQQVLTKPAGSLGRLEDIAVQFAGWQGQQHPSIQHIKVAVFAADHGVCSQGVSAFPQEVTTQMIANFLLGGAAISVMSESLGADFSVVNMGTVGTLDAALQQHPKLISIDIAHHTCDFTEQAAMTSEQLDAALAAGSNLILDVVNSTQPTPELFIGGEMGIGNTTSASAIYAAILSLPPADVAGPGTGVDQQGVRHKQQIIDEALQQHADYLSTPYDILRCLGGFEIAALVGSYISCAQQGIPVLVDGFICTAAALLAVKMNTGVRGWLLFSHYSAEPAHHLALEHMEASPLLDLGMRLGEGSGAAIAVPIIQSALLLHNNMATFTQAGVSDK